MKLCILSKKKSLLNYSESTRTNDYARDTKALSQSTVYIHYSKANTIQRENIYMFTYIIFRYGIKSFTESCVL